jgi:hypothetical protein
MGYTIINPSKVEKINACATLYFYVVELVFEIYSDGCFIRE